MAHWPISSQFSYIPDSQGAAQGMRSFPLGRGGCWRKRRERGKGRVPQLRAQRPDAVVI